MKRLLPFVLLPLLCSAAPQSAVTVDSQTGLLNSNYNNGSGGIATGFIARPGQVFNFSNAAVIWPGTVTQIQATLSVPSIAALEGAVGQIDGQYAVTAGYYTVNDGGSALYLFSSSSSATANGGTVIAPNVGSGRWLLQYDGFLNVLSFGAKGDNSTDNYTALYGAAQAITAAGGGTLYFPSGTYQINQQPHSPTQALDFESAGAVTLVGSSAVLKFAASQSYTDAGSPLNILTFTSCTSVSVRGFEIDGNVINMTVTGTPTNGFYGIAIYSCPDVNLSDLYVHGCGLDDITLNNATLLTTPMQRVSFTNLRCEYAGRNIFSWVGGNGLTATNCKFDYAGEINVPVYGYLRSSPNNGVDIEPEDTYCFNGQFINCEMAYNYKENLSVATNANAYNFVFDSCRLIATNFRNYYSPSPQISFRNCLFAGTTDGGIGPQYDNCTFTLYGTYSETGSVFGDTGFFDFTGGAYTSFRNCTFDGGVAGGLPGFRADKTLINCNFTQAASGTYTPVGNYYGVTAFTVTALGSITQLGNFWGPVYLNSVLQPGAFNAHDHSTSGNVGNFSGDASAGNGVTFQGGDGGYIGTKGYAVGGGPGSAADLGISAGSGGALLLGYNGGAFGAQLDTNGLKTATPSGGTAASWKFGTVHSVSPTSPDRTIELSVGGTTYFITAKTTDD